LLFRRSPALHELSKQKVRYLVFSTPNTLDQSLIGKSLQHLGRSFDLWIAFFESMRPQYQCDSLLDNEVAYDSLCDIMKVVLDTNIIVAGLYSKRGASYLLLKAAISGQMDFAVSPLVALEYEGTLNEKIEDGFLSISKEHCGRILSALFARASIVWRPLQIRPTLSDSSDDKILECAVSSNSTHIITFNKRHFPAAITTPWGIKVMTAGEFLEQWRNKA
jgi:putative PIN family toxin of toxin-antitoxin system